MSDYQEILPAYDPTDRDPTTANVSFLPNARKQPGEPSHDPIISKGSVKAAKKKAANHSAKQAKAKGGDLAALNSLLPKNDPTAGFDGPAGNSAGLGLDGPPGTKGKVDPARYTDVRDRDGDKDNANKSAASTGGTTVLTGSGSGAGQQAQGIGFFGSVWEGIKWVWQILKRFALWLFQLLKKLPDLLMNPLVWIMAGVILALIVVVTINAIL